MSRQSPRLPEWDWRESSRCPRCERIVFEDDIDAMWRNGKLWHVDCVREHRADEYARRQRRQNEAGHGPDA